ncbi:MAG: GYD domain-containing protein, partial [Acidimicrobiia bacterium]
MAKYMLQVALSLDGLKGTMKEGGTTRRKNLEKVLDSVGGSVEAFYYAFGEDDVI